MNSYCRCAGCLIAEAIGGCPCQDFEVTNQQVSGAPDVV